MILWEPLLLALPIRIAVPGYVLKACGFCAHTPGNAYFYGQSGKAPALLPPIIVT